MGAAAILGGVKRDDLPKDGVREIADAVHPRFYGFLGSGGGRVAVGVKTGGSRVGGPELCV